MARQHLQACGQGNDGVLWMLLFPGGHRTNGSVCRSAQVVIGRTALSADQHRYFEQVCIYCRDFLDLIPITFVLGFYVSLVVTRWWNIYMNLPWVDRTCVLIATYIHGKDERGRMIRRSLVRYLNLMAVLTLRCVSTVVIKRFPTMEHLLEAGLLTDEEFALLESVNGKNGIYFQPAFWFASLAMQARKEGRIHDDYFLTSMVNEMNAFRGCCGMLMSYDWISIPLVYTQVVTLATYTFFLACAFGKQYIDSVDSKYTTFSKYFPLFTFIQFFFYMGWLKVAEALINPLGDDDDDFELNYLLDRNLQVGFTMVDELYGKYPKLSRDPFWDNTDPTLPYTAAAAYTMIPPYLGSVKDITISTRNQEWLLDVPEEHSEVGTSSGSGGRRSLRGTPPTSFLNRLRRASTIRRSRFLSLVTPAHSRRASTLSINSNAKASDMIYGSVRRLGRQKSTDSNATSLYANVGERNPSFQPDTLEGPSTTTESTYENLRESISRHPSATHAHALETIPEAVPGTGTINQTMDSANASDETKTNP